MMCQIYSNDRKPQWVNCGEQATMLWAAPQQESPVPCCAYHAQCCPQGEIVSMARHEAAGLVTFIHLEAHA
jgi:hypothetical protein